MSVEEYPINKRITELENRVADLENLVVQLGEEVASLKPIELTQEQKQAFLEIARLMEVYSSG